MEPSSWLGQVKTTRFVLHATTLNRVLSVAHASVARIELPSGLKRTGWPLPTAGTGVSSPEATVRTATSRGAPSSQSAMCSRVASALTNTVSSGMATYSGSASQRVSATTAASRIRRNVAASPAFDGSRMDSRVEASRRCPSDRRRWPGSRVRATASACASSRKSVARSAADLGAVALPDGTHRQERSRPRPQ